MPLVRTTHAKRRIAIVGVALLAAVLVAGLASAQGPANTELTPQPAAPTQWTVWGAKFGGRGDMFTASPAPYTVDFFSTSFSPDGSVGFFGGAACAPDTAFDDQALRTCPRHPAIYRYSTDSFGDARIDEMDLPGGNRGFVGAIAWIDGHRALAVGGTGVYPRREPPAQADDAAYASYDKSSWAGSARAWLYQDGVWHDVTDRLPAGAGALTALACAPPGDATKVDPSLQGRCLAGGMQQLFWWQPAADNGQGGFQAVTGIANVATVAEPIHFRVRAIRFAPAGNGAFTSFDTPGSEIPTVVAVTSGCCAAPGSTATGARLIAYFHSSNVWRIEPFAGTEDTSNGSGGAGLPDSLYSVVYSDTPGSYDGVAFTLSAVASPGGEGAPATGEPGSRIVVHAAGASTNLAAPELDPLDTKLDSLRLVAADGDYAGTPLPGSDTVGLSGSRDGMFDWAVGSFKATGAGAAYTTIPSETPLPNPLTCSVLGGLNTSCKPAQDNVARASLASRRMVAMGTYALNALSSVPGTDGGQAWAAGDRGAIARLGGSGHLGAENEPPVASLGSPVTSPVDRPPGYDPFPIPIPHETGVVPPLALQPATTLSESRLEPAGTPDPTRWDSGPDHPVLPHETPVGSMAMSRNGSEGWAVGPGAAFSLGSDGLVLQHYDGERWVRCDPTGLGGKLPADRACADLTALANRRLPSGQPAPVGLAAVARIPWENDGDPSNDGEFAATAIGTPMTTAGLQAAATVLDYQDGKWEVDSQASTEIQISSSQTAVHVAFASPDDGWLTVVNGSGGALLYHYTDGSWPHGHWRSCGTAASQTLNATACGTGIDQLPLGTPANLQLQVAGDTVFVAGTRYVGSGNAVGYPFVASRRLDGSNPWRMEYDPGCPPPSTPPNCAGGSTQDQGLLDSMSVADLGKDASGHERFAGWLLGSFGNPTRGQGPAIDATRSLTGPASQLIRREPDSGAWAPRTIADAADAVLAGRGAQASSTLLSYRGQDGQEQSFILPASFIRVPRHAPLEYNPRADRWNVMPAPFVSNPKTTPEQLVTEGAFTAAAPDGAGGFWAAVQQGLAVDPTPDDAVRPSAPTFYYHYTDRVHAPVFRDTAYPGTEPIQAIAGTPGGELWVATQSDTIYHYDRRLAWQRLHIKGWDPGKTVTRPSHALAVAVNAAGDGVVAGEHGRIADLAPEEVELDAASAHRCSDGPPPCGTPQDLDAVSVAPDGSAMIGGKALTLLWRPAGGPFQTIDRPTASVHTTITGVSLPTPDRAWITTDRGEIWTGFRHDSTWRWALESGAPAAADERQSHDEPNGRAQLNAIALDAQGRGLAVGYRGAMLERAADGTWSRLSTGYLDDLYSIALPPGGYGDGTLVGGDLGLVLTRVGGRFHTARPADIFDPLTNAAGPAYAARIVGLALSAGSADGDVEAWAASAPGPRPPSGRQDLPSALLHYASSVDPLLHPEPRAQPLADTPADQPGEITLAAFGRSECHLGQFCPEFEGTDLFNEVVSRRIAAAVQARRARATGPVAAIFTGDMNIAAGRDRMWEDSLVVAGRPNLPLDTNLTGDEWRDAVADPLLDHDVAVFATPGKTDLSRAQECANATTCFDTQSQADAGLSLQWRTTFAHMPAPWGDAAPASSNGATFEPVAASPVTGTRVGQPTAPAPGGGANTHYAVDVVNEDGNASARIIVLDDSIARSLSASDVDQNPVGQDQAQWLGDVLCIHGETCSTSASHQRQPGEPAVVVTNAPLYSYGPGALDSTESDGSVLETLLLRNRATAVISGRLGWNGLFYLLASGVHSPCPGATYPAGPPESEAAPCGAQVSGTPKPPSVGTQQLADALRGQGISLPPQVEQAFGTAGSLIGAVPNLVASSAGGRFGPDGTGDGSANDGYWHGYSVLRLEPDGTTVVEQRPILDWVGIDGPTHTLHPGQRLALHGYGREPVGMDTPARMDAIDSPAITHRFDLLEADPQHPWLPKVDPELADEPDHPHGYTFLDPSVATIGLWNGHVIAGRSNHPRVYAVAVMSVGDHAATYPLVFEPRRSYTAPSAPRVAVGTIPATRVLGFAPHSLDPPSAIAPTAPPPQVNTSVQLPAPPALPNLPNPVGGAAAPPAPGAPPAPPSGQTSAAATLSVSPVGVALPPTPGVTAQPTPPVQPTPPSGARREARQRQAATAKSEEKGGGEGVDPKDAQTRVNPVDSPHSYSRHESPLDGRHAFTALAQPDHSPLDGLLTYGGGLTLLALALALGWTGVRPTPRRRRPTIAAPAWHASPTNRRRT